jgi:protein-S-isoprenylcysteine O-methyltransferase Ste14
MKNAVPFHISEHSTAQHSTGTLGGKSSEVHSPSDDELFYFRRMQAMAYLELSFLWAAYCALHSYLISTHFAGIMTRLLKRYFAFYRLAYVLLSVALLIPLLEYSSHFVSPIVIEDGPALDIARKILAFLSLGIFFWSFLFDYDPLSFFGIRQIMNLRQTKTPSTSLGINRKGLLGILRHPMYFSLIVYLWSQTRTLAEVLINTVLTIYVFIGTILEEKKLILEFGDVYVKYQHEVPMLIPGIRIRRNPNTIR